MLQVVSEQTSPSTTWFKDEPSRSWWACNVFTWWACNVRGWWRRGVVRLLTC